MQSTLHGSTFHDSALRGYRTLWARYLRPYWHKVTLIALLLLGTIGLQLLNPQIVRRFIDAAQAGQPLRTLSLLALLSSVSFVVGLSRRRRKDEILAAKTVKKVNALAPVVAEAIARQATASPASVPAADQTPTA